ncbi:MAG: helix-hairpin-helix domain-containing protein [Patescibacteria group bacterium]
MDGYKKVQQTIKEWTSHNTMVLVALVIGSVLLNLMLMSDVLEADTKVIYKSSSSSDSNASNTDITYSIAGAVSIPGVYKVKQGTRLYEILELAGGYSDYADVSTIEPTLNIATVVGDGEHIYIPYIWDRTNSSLLNPLGDTNLNPQLKINLNNSTKETLQTLPGVGEVYSARIIEHRPYTNIEEFLEKTKVPSNIFAKFSNDVSL